MQTHNFRLILTGLEEMTLEASEALFEAGCDDGSPGSSGLVSHIDFHRDAQNFEEAVLSAIDNVKAAGFGVKAVQDYDTDEQFLTPAIALKLREKPSELSPA